MLLSTLPVRFFDVESLVKTEAFFRRCYQFQILHSFHFVSNTEFFVHFRLIWFLVRSGFESMKICFSTFTLGFGTNFFPGLISRIRIRYDSTHAGLSALANNACKTGFPTESIATWENNFLHFVTVFSLKSPETSIL